MTEKHICQSITGAIWAAGAGLLCLLWHTHLSNQALDLLLGFVVYVATFFYVFTLMPIYWFVGRRLSIRA
jgi:RsiW-degrading membrane proteinase PrsW (M82 family)